MFRHRPSFVWPTVVAVVAMSLPAASTDAARCWLPPVSAPVTDPFRAPACRWCPGNRGLEYATRPGQAVRAVDTGRVSWAGTIAGVTYVVVEHRDGLRATYGTLADRRHHTGDLVLRGQIVGLAGRSFHFGVRRGDRYLDPARFFGRWVGQPRLVPLDARHAAPASAPRFRCRR